MSLLDNVALALAYAKAPRLTFVARHPRAGFGALAFTKGLRRSSTVRRVSAGLIGLGALAAVVPAVGLWLARRS